MSFFAIKTLLAALLVAAGLTAALSMLTLMGRSERRLGVGTLQKVHRAAGYVFAGLLVLVGIMGFRYLAAAGDTLPLRGVLHWTLAVLLALVLALKIAIVRAYKQFLKFVPALGMSVITLVLLVAVLSAGYFAVTGAKSRGVPQAASSSRPRPDDNTSGPTGTQAVAAVDDVSGGPAMDSGSHENAGSAEDSGSSGDAENGRAVFGQYCASCHRADSRNPKIGPGLARLFERDKLPATGRPVTRENVRAQILTPVGTMPAFEGHIADEDVEDLLSYIETL